MAKRMKCPRGCVPVSGGSGLGAAPQSPEARALWLAKQISKWSPAGQRMQGDKLRQWRVQHFVASLAREGIVLTSEDYKRLAAIVTGGRPLPGFAPGLGVHPGPSVPDWDQPKEWVVLDTRSGTTKRVWFATRGAAEAWNNANHAGYVQRFNALKNDFEDVALRGLGSVEDGLDDFEARDLLYQWHGGGGSGVYQVASMMDHGVPEGAYERARGELAYTKRQNSQYNNHEQQAELDALIAWLDGKIGSGTAGLGGAPGGGLWSQAQAEEIIRRTYGSTDPWAEAPVRRVGSAHAEHPKGDRTYCRVCGWVETGTADPAWHPEQYVDEGGGTAGLGHSDEPDEDDITTGDHHRWYQSGKLYFTGDEAGLRRKMDKDRFWPNAWFISDHGNAHLIEV